MDTPDYIRKFNQAIVENPQYFKRITESLFEYWGDTPEAWLRERIKEARTYLIKKEGLNPQGKPYKNFKMFMANQLTMKYDWLDPQGLKTYIDNEEEQKHYSNKRK